jgi:alpha-acetolactate decarboxylase
MTRYRVRPGFYVHLSEEEVASPGDIIDLTKEEFQLYAHQLEPVEQPKESKDGKSKVQS